ncbi:DUF3105 domain-containing protein [Actinokineospora pegani]|uniref:DUF3105 domain-containing protein n=1 Tax=Actinokineospora pegani TaxID=2654637 RepID=UPI0012EAFFAE|nr:DUF3105 domain-containing protein [Actinokineospora pegani]
MKRLLPSVAAVCLLLSACGSAAPPADDVRAYAPTAEDKDPTERIEGVFKKNYAPGGHITADQRVAYRYAPPLGGPHDEVWAACDGVVYPRPVRTENMVHSMEHGAVWIAYNPDQVSGDQLGALAAKVDGQPFTLMSPWPGLDSPVSVQSWGRQLKVDSADDPRIDRFIVATRANEYLNPEPGAPCAPVAQELFDVDNPPPFVADPGPAAVPDAGA